MSQEYNIEELGVFLREETIPIIKANPKTFLGIAKQPHYENVLSNIYAFYFQPNEEHGLGDLFIKSFIELINEKTKDEFYFTDYFEVVTEYYTKKGGRIDLLLLDKDNAIIIENKVYHYLNNDLIDYWDSVEPKNKIGVVFSLHQVGFIPSSHFVNITHKEFLQKVFFNIGSYILNANEKFLVFLKDIYQNIKNLSNTMETENLHFFYENRKKIDDVIKLRDSMSNFIKQKVDTSQKLIEIGTINYSVRGYNEARLRYFLSPQNRDLYFTILFDGLLKESMELMLIIEMEGKALEVAESFRNIEFTNEELTVIVSDFYSKLRKSYAHFAIERYILNERDVLNLSDFIANKINHGALSKIFNKLDEKLSSIRMESKR